MFIAHHAALFVLGLFMTSKLVLVIKHQRAPWTNLMKSMLLPLMTLAIGFAANCRLAHGALECLAFMFPFDMLPQACAQQC
jgi:hypothetical protein